MSEEKSVAPSWAPHEAQGMRHTPGPWRIEQDGLPELRNVSTYVCAGDRDDGVLVCEINTSADDARLIAAAPDLLAALQRLVAVYEDEFGIVAPEMDAAWSAILKATGATSAAGHIPSELAQDGARTHSPNVERGER